MPSARLKLLQDLAGCKRKRPATTIVGQLMAHRDVKRANGFAGQRIAVTTEGKFDPTKTDAYIRRLLQGGAPESQVDGEDTLALNDIAKMLR